MKNEHTQAINAITAEMEDILKFGKRAENTISTYKTYAVPYLEYCFDTLGKSPCESSEKDVRSFLSCIQADRDLDDRTINNAIPYDDPDADYLYLQQVEASDRQTVQAERRGYHHR